LPEAKDYSPLLEQLVQSPNLEEQVSLVKHICAQLHQRLLASGWVTGTNANPWLLPLLNDCNELKAQKAG